MGNSVLKILTPYDIIIIVAGSAICGGLIVLLIITQFVDFGPTLTPVSDKPGTYILEHDNGIVEILHAELTGASIPQPEKDK